jgi:hypothetical protein
MHHHTTCAQGSPAHKQVTVRFTCSALLALHLPAMLLGMLPSIAGAAACTPQVGALRDKLAESRADKGQLDHWKQVGAGLCF